MVMSTTAPVPVVPSTTVNCVYSSQVFLDSPRGGQLVLPIVYSSTSQTVSDEKAQDLVRNIRNMQKLEKFRSFEKDWNGDQAETFSLELLARVRNVLNSNILPRQPEIFPLADGSIQMEWEKKNGEYLEITTNTSKTWDVLQLDENENEKGDGKIAADSALIGRLVERFYADGI